jgi:hypothetical protein
MLHFEGCEPIPPLREVIEISAQGMQWDLHNLGEFQRFAYDNSNRSIALEWFYWDIAGRIVKQPCVIELLDIASFFVEPRDADMPFTEDDCLYSMLSDPINSKIEFKFHGGLRIVVICSRFRFHAPIGNSGDNSEDGP